MFALVFYWRGVFVSQPRLYGGELLDLVASHFQLKEKLYFGLSFKDERLVVCLGFLCILLLSFMAYLFVLYSLV